jgi:hypothetical protein
MYWYKLQIKWDHKKMERRNLEGQVSIFIPPSRGGPVIPPGSLFVACYDSQGYDGGLFARLHTGFLVLNG